MSQPLAIVATQFLDRPNLAKSTVRSYELTLMPLLRMYGSWSIDLMDNQLLSDYLNSLTHLSYTTHHRHQATLNALLNFAVRQGYIHSNPIAQLSRLKPDKTKGEHLSDQPIRYLSAEQLGVLYQAIYNDARLYALVKLLHHSGTRISEVLALDLEEVDLLQRKFQVVGKGNKTRWCFYSEDAAEALQKYIQFYRYTPSTALFSARKPPTSSVTRMSYRTAHHHWHQSIQGYQQLQGVRLHDLRHTFATERVGLMGIEELRALMGHQHIQTTLQYQKVTSQQAEGAAHRAFQRIESIDKNINQKTAIDLI